MLVPPDSRRHSPVHPPQIAAARQLWQRFQQSVQLNDTSSLLLAIAAIGVVLVSSLSAPFGVVLTCIGGGLIVCLLLAHIVATLPSQWRSWHTPPIDQREEFYTRLPGTSFQTFSILPFELARAVLVDSLRRRRYTVRQQQRGDAIFFLAQRHRYVSWNILVVQVGAVGLLLSMLVGWLAGQSRSLGPLSAGETVTLDAQAGLQVRMEAFSPQDVSQDGTPIAPSLVDESVRLTVLRHHRIERTAIVRPGTPVMVGDFQLTAALPPASASIYVVHLSSISNASSKRTGATQQSTPTPAPTPGLPDPTRWEASAHIILHSSGNNSSTPALAYLLDDHMFLAVRYISAGSTASPDNWGTLAVRLWRLTSSGSFHLTMLTSPVQQVMIGQHAYNMGVIRSHQVLVAFVLTPLGALAIHRNPGQGAADFFMVIILLGFVVRCYIPDYRLWAKVRQDPAGSAVFVCGTATHGNARFSRVFAELAAELRQSLAPHPALPQSGYRRPVE